MDETRRVQDLEQALRDERARRQAAERRIEELTDRADVWRRRAEERAERITRIEGARATRFWRSGPLGRFLARSNDRGTDEGADLGVDGVADGSLPSAASQELSPDGRGVSNTTPVVVDRLRPSIKSVMVVASVSDPGITRCLSAFDVRDFADVDAADLERADLVVVEPEALNHAVSGTRERLAAWAGETGRQPLLVWTTRGDISDLSSLLSRGDVVAVTDAAVAGRLQAVHLGGCFDPAQHHPSPPGEPSEAAELVESRIRNLFGDNGRPHVPEERDAVLSAPPLWLVEAAASGVGLDDTPGAGTAARRWAYRHHAPWIRAGEILDLVGLRAPDALPRIAGILVSHRPESLPVAIASVLRQTHAHTELVVGIHGASPTPEIETALAQASIPVELLTLDRNQSLGECLNLAISRTSAPLLAKIDDDDHYGPAHLEDSFHTISYSGTDIVGKGAQYTYLASRNVTVLRRPGQEEMLIDGSPNGATLVFRRSVWEEVGFPNRPRHVDTGFLRAARQVGGAVYAGSRWEFCYVRNTEGHTWEAEDSVFMAGSDAAWDGFHPDQVEVADVGAR